MNIKKLITISLFVFIAVSIGYLLYSEMAPSEKVKAVSSDKGPKELSDKAIQNNTGKDGSRIAVYYFHTTHRCFSCKKIEALTRKAIDENFKSEHETGLLKIYSVNVDNPENRHFIDDFKLVSKSVVLVSLDKEKIKQWKLLPKIWELLQDDTQFIDYIKNETETFLKENS